MSNYRVSDEEVAFIIERRPFLSTDHALASDLRFARTDAFAWKATAKAASAALDKAEKELHHYRAGHAGQAIGVLTKTNLNTLQDLEDCRDAHMEAWRLLTEVRDTFTGNDADGAPGADGSYWLGHSLALKIHYFLTPPPNQDAPTF